MSFHLLKQTEITPTLVQLVTMSRDDILNDIQAKVEEKNLPQLLKRNFVSVNTDEDADVDSVVRIMQWNMLAQALSGDNFIRCPPEALVWDIRKLRVLEEILRFNPSLICLEEVDHFSYIEECLRPLGYAGLFLPKPHSVCLRFENNNGPDGCALFYLKEKYELLQNEDIFLKNDGISTNQVALLCKFHLKSCNSKKSNSGQDFFLAVTHLKAKEGKKDLNKETYLLKELFDKCGTLPLIICGDFNAESDEKVYQAFSNSPLGLCSAYTSLTDDKTEPPYTTWKVRQGRDGDIDKCRTIDYMWYRKDKAKVIRLLNFPTVEEIGYTRLPSFSYPSDHLSLVCDIKVYQLCILFLILCKATCTFKSKLKKIDFVLIQGSSVLIFMKKKHRDQPQNDLKSNHFVFQKTVFESAKFCCIFMVIANSNNLPPFPFCFCFRSLQAFQNLPSKSLYIDKLPVANYFHYSSQNINIYSTLCIEFTCYMNDVKYTTSNIFIICFYDYWNVLHYINLELGLSPLLSFESTFYGKISGSDRFFLFIYKIRLGIPIEPVSESVTPCFSFPFSLLSRIFIINSDFKRPVMDSSFGRQVFKSLRIYISVISYNQPRYDRRDSKLTEFTCFKIY
ncbi:LOW QUALITY PROTEIN: hypothetical protein KUTeg_024054, partial [Tegillarca granosa]